jgi:hypothetical protein
MLFLLHIHTRTHTTGVGEGHLHHEIPALALGKGVPRGQHPLDLRKREHGLLFNPGRYPQCNYSYNTLALSINSLVATGVSWVTSQNTNDILCCVRP